MIIYLKCLIIAGYGSHTYYTCVLIKMTWCGIAHLWANFRGKDNGAGRHKPPNATGSPQTSVIQSPNRTQINSLNQPNCPIVFALAA